MRMKGRDGNAGKERGNWAKRRRGRKSHALQFCHLKSSAVDTNKPASEEPSIQ